MRFLADENMARAVISRLRELGHEVVSIVEDAPQIADNEIADWIKRDQLILLTHDKDFGKLARDLYPASECGIVLFRLDTASSDDMTEKIVASVRSRSDWAGNITVVDEQKIRVRRLGPSSGF